MGISIVMTSGKGGTGKTTCTAAIAEALALMGKKVGEIAEAQVPSGILRLRIESITLFDEE